MFKFFQKKSKDKKEDKEITAYRKSIKASAEDQASLTPRVVIGGWGR